MRVLHVLHHSAPYLDGYAVRSKHIVDFQRAAGLDVRVLTSAQHETEVARQVAPAEPETIDGVPYHRTPLPFARVPRMATAPFLRELGQMKALLRSIERVAAREPVDVIHAHSPVLCGLPAMAAAARLGVPLVYEVRGFWEDGFVERWRGGARSLRYRISRRLETRVFRNAEAIVSIARHLHDDIAGRGIDARKLHYVPNGVDTQRFVPAPPDPEIVARHRLGGTRVVGFIGSFFRWEGLDCLVDAIDRVRRLVPDVRLLLVGGGEQEAAVAAQVSRLGLSDVVTLTGMVPHADVAKYYTVMDVLVYPRHRSRITETVTPLKPLEAMAMGKPVIGSDVGGLRELLDEGVGLEFEAGDAEQLADRIAAALSDDRLRASLGSLGRERVLRTRGWDRLIARYVELYESLIDVRPVAAVVEAARL
jgi:PEP-CTERM/exosortase A-associated glycosyltransferase